MKYKGLLGRGLAAALAVILTVQPVCADAIAGTGLYEAGNDAAETGILGVTGAEEEIAAVSEYMESGIHTRKNLTMDELRALYNSITAPTSIYSTNADIDGSDYHIAVLTEDALQSGEDTVNYFRTAAGLDTLSFTDAANTHAAWGALICAMNDVLAHSQAKPAAMSDADYTLANAATGSSNLHAQYGLGGNIISRSIWGFMNDEDESNIDRLGHRRWVLNPGTRTMGIGAAKAAVWSYVDLKVFGDYVTRENENDYDFVAWPASGNNISDLFAKDVPWSVTLNPSLYAAPSLSKVKVTLKNESDGTVYTFDQSTGKTFSSSAGYFNVDNAGYAVNNCIVFRPPYSGFSAYSGDYTVEISGITDKAGNAKTIKYLASFDTLAKKSGENSSSTKSSSSSSIKSSSSSIKSSSSSIKSSSSSSIKSSSSSSTKSSSSSSAKEEDDDDTVYQLQVPFELGYDQVFEALEGIQTYTQEQGVTDDYRLTTAMTQYAMQTAAERLVTGGNTAEREGFSVNYMIAGYGSGGQNKAQITERLIEAFKQFFSKYVVENSSDCSRLPAVRDMGIGVVFSEQGAYSLVICIGTDTSGLLEKCESCEEVMSIGYTKADSNLVIKYSAYPDITAFIEDTVKVGDELWVYPYIEESMVHQKVIPENVRYHSSNTSVLTVDEEGKIRAVGEGEAYIYIECDQGTVQAYTLTVKSGSSSSSSNNTSSSSVKSDSSSSSLNNTGSSSAVVPGMNSTTAKSTSVKSTTAKSTTAKKGKTSSSTFVYTGKVENAKPIVSDLQGAVAKGLGSEKDTLKIGMINKTAAVAVSAGTNKNVITVAKGNKIKLEAEYADPKSYVSDNKKLVAVSKKGVITAKKPTDGVNIHYTVGGVDRILKVVVIEPMAERVVSGYNGMAVCKKLTYTVSAAEAKTVKAVVGYKVPCNAEILPLKTKLADFKAEMSKKDGLLYVSGPFNVKGSVVIPFTVNGKKFKAKLVIKK